MPVAADSPAIARENFFRMTMAPSYFVAAKVTSIALRFLVPAPRTESFAMIIPALLCATGNAASAAANSNTFFSITAIKVLVTGAAPATGASDAPFVTGCINTGVFTDITVALFSAISIRADMGRPGRAHVLDITATTEATVLPLKRKAALARVAKAALAFVGAFHAEQEQLEGTQLCLLYFPRGDSRASTVGKAALRGNK